MPNHSGFKSKFGLKLNTERHLINIYITEMSFISSHGFLYRNFYNNISMLLSRYKYYFAWVMGKYD